MSSEILRIVRNNARLYTAMREGNILPRAPKSIAISKSDVGQRLRTVRTKRGLTQQELANLLGTNQSHIANVERGERGVTIHQIVKLAKALQVSTDEILFGKHGAQDTTPAKTDRRFLRRLQRISSLPNREKQALITTIDAFLSKTG
jgi:transcriptional regulator with XRE-family HTH domain